MGRQEGHERLVDHCVVCLCVALATNPQVLNVAWRMVCLGIGISTGR